MNPWIHWTKTYCPKRGGIQIANFKTVFNVTLNQPVVDNLVFLTLTGDAGYLMVGYDANAGAFYLQDHAGNRTLATVEFKNTDWLSIGVSQSATTRRLFVSSFSTGAAQSSERPFGPIGSFTAAFLYPKLL